MGPLAPSMDEVGALKPDGWRNSRLQSCVGTWLCPRGSGPHSHIAAFRMECAPQIARRSYSVCHAGARDPSGGKGGTTLNRATACAERQLDVESQAVRAS